MNVLISIKSRTAAAALLGGIVLGGPALAEGPRILAEHFPRGGDVCYERAYDAAHLAAHPQQKISRIRLTSFPNAWGVYDPSAPDDGTVVFGIAVEFRDRPTKIFDNGGGCTPDGGELACFIDCDGGRFRLAASGADAILFRNEGFAVMGCGEQETAPAKPTEEEIQALWVDPEPDDKVFKLTRVTGDRCVAPALPEGAP